MEGLDPIMFHDNLAGLLRVLVVGPLAYIWLIATLRITGKRTLAQLNAFDFIVTVALGSTLATVVLSETVSLSEGALALVLLTLLQLAAAWASVRSPRIRHLITTEPTVLLRDGHPVVRTLQQERISDQSLRQAVRSAGYGGLELVACVVLETNGQLSVVPQANVGSGSALVDRHGHDVADRD